MSKYPYVDKYLENRKHVTLTNQVCGHLDLIKKQLDLKSNNDAVQYLIDIEQSARKGGNIEEYGACAQCGAPINVELGSYQGITHHHIDNGSDCFGCIKTKYRVKTKIEVLPGTTEAKTVQKQAEQEIDTREEAPQIRF
jgi:hypothetical protein